jgi:uncharacterized membrane protein
MTTITAEAAPSRTTKLTPDTFDRILAGAAIVLLAAVAGAIWRGRAEWGDVPMFIWAHIMTIFVAVVLTPVMLLRRRGDRLHRRLGWVWVSALFLTALFTFGIRGVNGANLSWIHILSAWTLIQVPMIAWSARTHRVDWHRRSVRGMVAGALIIAGAFTFPVERLMGHWLFG